jgi:hypothetical protein
VRIWVDQESYVYVFCVTCGCFHPCWLPWVSHCSLVIKRSKTMKKVIKTNWAHFTGKKNRLNGAMQRSQQQGATPLIRGKDTGPLRWEMLRRMHLLTC